MAKGLDGVCQSYAHRSDVMKTSDMRSRPGISKPKANRYHVRALDRQVIRLNGSTLHYANSIPDLLVAYRDAVEGLLRFHLTLHCIELYCTQVCTIS